jgi:hypothetical protein
MGVSGQCRALIGLLPAGRSPHATFDRRMRWSHSRAGLNAVAKRELDPFSRRKPDFSVAQSIDYSRPFTDRVILFRYW